jgi:predicted nuclease of predicted toxin-antitoxin system
MKSLIDVNASGTVANWLSAQSHDVARVVERNPMMSDEEILEWALSEGRIIITTDKDFEEMIWRQNKSHSGILRLENLSTSRE